MAIRFDIDKYNKIRDSYLAYIRDGKVDAQLSPLYETYKAYWTNDTEVKKAEQEYKQKEKAESEKRRKIAELQLKEQQEWTANEDFQEKYYIMRHRHVQNVNSSTQIANEQNKKKKKPKIRVHASIFALSGLNDVDYAVQKALAGVTGSRVESMRTKNEESRYIYKGRPQIISIPSGGMNKRR